MRRGLQIAGAAFVLALIGLAMWAALAWRADPPPTVRGVQVEPTSLRVTEVARVRVQLDLPWHAQPLASARLAEESEDWQLRSTQVARSLPGNDNWRWVVDMELQAVRPDAEPPPTLLLPVASKRHAMKEIEIDISATPLAVQRTLSDTEVAQPLAAGTMPYVPLVAEHARWWLWLVAVGALLVILWLAYRVRNRTRPEPPPQPAWVVASTDLAALERALPMTDEAFFIGLSDILRSYLARRFRLPATTQATPEFLRSLDRASCPLTREQITHVRDILRAADAVKFARETRGEAAMRGLLAETRALVTDTTPAETEAAPSTVSQAG